MEDALTLRLYTEAVEKKLVTHLCQKYISILKLFTVWEEFSIISKILIGTIFYLSLKSILFYSNCIYLLTGPPRKLLVLEWIHHNVKLLSEGVGVKNVFCSVCRCFHEASPGQMGTICPVPAYVQPLVPRCTWSAWDTEVTPNSAAQSFSFLLVSHVLKHKQTCSVF